jgi:hypothetical protein
MSSEREQASKEFGIKLAKALIEHARVQAPAHQLDPRATILGASDYLAKHTEFWRSSPLDVGEVAPERRSN